MTAWEAEVLNLSLPSGQALPAALCDQRHR